ncbi:MAG: hypothetical protein QGG40_20880 [Myxococcota bacterium]|nr:hypothetical protein [Myxococcota bacterium]
MRTLSALLPILWAISCTGSTSKTDDSGSSDDTGSGTVDETVVWTDYSMETSSTLTGVFASGTGAYATGTGGEVWVRTQGEWRNTSIDVDDADLNGIWGQTAGNNVEAFVVGNDGWVGSWDNDTLSWATADVGTAGFEAVAGPSVLSLVAVGWGGIYEYTGTIEDSTEDTASTDSDTSDTASTEESTVSGTWEHVDLTGNPRFNHVAHDGSNPVAVGQEGAIAVQVASNWIVDEDEARGNLYGVSAVSSNDVWVVGEEGTVLHWDGIEWAEVSVGTSVTLWAVWAYDASNVYISGSNGLVLHYDGSGWSQLYTGVDNILYAIHGTDPTNIWAVGNKGLALRFTGE